MPLRLQTPSPKDILQVGPVTLTLTNDEPRWAKGVGVGLVFERFADEPFGEAGPGVLCPDSLGAAVQRVGVVQGELRHLLVGPDADTYQRIAPWRAWPVKLRHPPMARQLDAYGWANETRQVSRVEVAFYVFVDFPYEITWHQLRIDIEYRGDAVCRRTAELLPVEVPVIGFTSSERPVTTSRR